MAHLAPKPLNRPDRTTFKPLLSAREIGVTALRTALHNDFRATYAANFRAPLVTLDGARASTPALRSGAGVAGREARAPSAMRHPRRCADVPVRIPVGTQSVAGGRPRTCTP